jgi:hypothetical protein
MSASTTPSHHRSSHHPIAQIRQFGIPRAASLRIRRQALNWRALDTNDDAELPIVAAFGLPSRLRVNMRISA